MSTDGLTLASRTAAIGGTETRAAAAEARRVLLELAAERLDARVGDLTTAKGVVSVAATRALRHLCRARRRQSRSTASSSSSRTTAASSCRARTPTTPCPKPRDAYDIVGTRVPRPDIAEKIRGTYQYVHHVRLPGMLHGRVVWPRGQGAHGISNPDGRQHRRVVDRGHPRRADRAAEQLRRRGRGARVGCRARREPIEGHVATVRRRPSRATRRCSTASRSAKTNDLIDTDCRRRRRRARARRPRPSRPRIAGPYQSHGAMAPNCAVADVTSDGALVICSSQAILSDALRPGAVARLAARQDPRAVRRGLEHLRQQLLRRGRERRRDPVAGGRQAGSPAVQPRGRVRLGQLWPRAALRAAGGRRRQGKLVALDYQAWSHATAWLDTASQLALGTPPPTGGFGAACSRGRAAPASSRSTSRKRTCTTSESAHRQPRRHRRRLLAHRRAARADGSVDVLRAGRHDGRARARREARSVRVPQTQHLAPALARRARGGASAAKWTPRVAASQRSNARSSRAAASASARTTCRRTRAIASRIAAAVVDIEVNKDTGVVVAKHVYGAMDCGLAINPGIVESQIVGMCVHGASLALCEEVQFNETNVTSLDWASYRTLRFGEHPDVTPIVVQRPTRASSGAGEEVLPAVVAAIGNAFFDATGVRLRQYPLTPSACWRPSARQPLSFGHILSTYEQENRTAASADRDKFSLHAEHTPKAMPKIELPSSICRHATSWPWITWTPTAMPPCSPKTVCSTGHAASSKAARPSASSWQPALTISRAAHRQHRPPTVRIGLRRSVTSSRTRSSRSTATKQRPSPTGFSSTTTSSATRSSGCCSARGTTSSPNRRRVVLYPAPDPQQGNPRTFTAGQENPVQRLED